MLAAPITRDCVAGALFVFAILLVIVLFTQFHMKNRLGSFFWVESALASVTALVAVLTLVWPQWIERVFGFDPDRNDGSSEWSLVIALCLAAVLLASLARREWYKELSGNS